MIYFELLDLKIEKKKIIEDLKSPDYTWPPWQTISGEIQDWYSLEVPRRPIVNLLQSYFSFPLKEEGIFYLKIRKNSVLDFHTDNNRSCTLVIPMGKGYTVDFLIDSKVKTLFYTSPTIINSSQYSHRIENKSNADRTCLYACFYQPIEDIYKLYQDKIFLRGN